MKQAFYVYRALGAFLLCLLSSCGGEEEPCAPAALEISAEIVKHEGNAASRAAIDIPEPEAGESNFDRQAFLAGDVIGVYTPGGNSSTVITPYKKDKSRWVTMAASSTAATTTDGTAYEAVFPYYCTAGSTTEGTVADIIAVPDADQSTKEKFLKNNKLVAQGTTVGNHLSLKFKHAFAKFTVVVNYASALVPNKVVMKVNGSAGITFCRTSGDASGKVHSYVGIINPGDWSGWSIEVTTGAAGSTTTQAHTQTFTAAKKIKAGYNYQFTFSATEELVLTGVTVTDFDAQPEEDMGDAT